MCEEHQILLPYRIEDMSFIRVIRRVTEKATPIQDIIMVAKQHTFLKIAKEIHGKLSADMYKSFDGIPHNWIKGRAGFCKNSLANLTLLNKCGRYFNGGVTNVYAFQFY